MIHANLPVVLTLVSNFRFCEEVPQPVSEPVICVSHPVMPLKLLRNFGHLITNLHIDYSLFYLRNIYTLENPHYVYPYVFPLCKEIDHYLEEYCSESLREISFQSSCLTFTHIMLEEVQKPFNNVKMVHTQCCRFRDVLPFNKVFPNLHTLKLGMNQYIKSSAIRVHFPSVENLWFFDRAFQNPSKILNEEDIEDMLKLNPQLKNALFYLRHDYNSNFIARLREYCPNLQFLQNGRYPFNHSFFSFIAFYNKRHLKDGRKTFTGLTESNPIKISDKYKNTLQELFELNMRNHFAR